MQETSIELSQRQDFRPIQDEAFKKHLDFIKNHSTFYQKRFAELGISFDQINSLDDLNQIPVTSKNEVEKHNDEFIAVTPREIIEFVTTSGTLGNPISTILTKADQERLAFNEYISLSLCGVTPDDVVQITTTLDKRFMAGMAYYLGATKLGAAVIRSGIGDPSFQLDNIQRFNPTVLIAVPSFAYKLGSFLQSKGIDPKTTSIEKIICIGEPIRNTDFSSNTLNQKLSEVWGVKLYSTYASTEMATAFTECDQGQGGHLIPELIHIEILDEQNQSVADGEVGEIVVTPFGIEGTPLIRYKTGDLARLHTEPCACGRLTPRLGPIEGRKDQMIKFKGTTLFPQQIENILNSFEGLDTYIMELSLDELGLDSLNVVFPDTMSNDIISDIKLELQQKLRVLPHTSQKEIGYIMSQVLPKGSRKPRRFVDKRTA
ncbi:MAG: AMP-binding protein [Reichenbachiella sp.]